MQIRILGYKDALAYQTLRLQGLQINPESFSSSYKEVKKWTIEDFEKRLTPQGYHFTLGAFKDNMLVGIVTFQQHLQEKLKHKGTISGMYVDIDFRNQGIARALLEHLFQLIQKLEGLEQVQLSVTATNETAICLYESFGFEQYALEKRALKVAVNYLDEAFMVKYI